MRLLALFTYTSGQRCREAADSLRAADPATKLIYRYTAVRACSSKSWAAPGQPAAVKYSSCSYIALQVDLQRTVSERKLAYSALTTTKLSARSSDSKIWIAAKNQTFQIAALCFRQVGKSRQREDFRSQAAGRKRCRK